MPPPEVWGPATWTLFHVLAEKVNEFVYPRIAGQIFDVIKRICSALPCPECAQDATIFLSKVRVHELRTKNDFKNMVYMFHNYVNAKKRRPLFNYANLEIYKKYNIVSVFNRFISVYHTKGNMRLLAESFQRQLIVRNIREWFSRNCCFFIPRQQAPTVDTVYVEVPGVEAVVLQEVTVYEEQPVLNEATGNEAIEPEVVQEEVVQEEALAPEQVVPVTEEVQEEVVKEEAVQEEEVVPVTEEVQEEEEEVVPVTEKVQEEAVQEEVVESEATGSEATGSEATGSEATRSEAVVGSEAKVTEEPVKAKRGRKKKTA